MFKKYAVFRLVLAMLPLVIPRQLNAQGGFITVPAGEYKIGWKDNLDNPPRKVKSRSFQIAAKEITNKEFYAFVAATNYRTEAERYKNAMVFEPGLEAFRWLQDSTAYWRFPNGISRGSIEDKMDHPVTGISYTDAIAYCKWAGVRLPTLDEWEIAARAGSATKYFDGVALKNIGRFANIWQGSDHLKADSSDGFMYTAPAGSFKPNPLGLYDVFGNVFEFCEGALPRDNGRKVAHARGGSWWCSKNACNFFNAVDIGAVNPHASFSNLGFRVAKDGL